MNRPAPPLLTGTDLCTSQPPGYEWDDWDPYSQLGDPDQRTQALLRAVSGRAKLAFAIGCTEWIVGRLDAQLGMDRSPWHFIEACWAFEMSDDYALPPESDESQWQGIVRAPVDLALMTILNTSIGIEDDNAEVDAAFAAQIALHVQCDRGPFLTWRRLALHRLRRLYPAAEGEPMGEPVPREAVQFPSRFDPRTAAADIKNFLAAVHVGSNPFLIACDDPVADDGESNDAG